MKSQASEIFDICLTSSCDDFLVFTNNQLLKHQEAQHLVIDFTQFQQRFGTLIKPDVEEKYSNILDQVIQSKEKLVKKFDVLLDRIIKESIFFDFELQQIFNCWNSNERERIFSMRQIIQDIWTNGPKSQDYDINKSYEELRSSFKRIGEQFDQLSKTTNKTNLIEEIIQYSIDQLKVNLESSQVQQNNNQSQWDSQILKNQITYQFSPTYKHENFSLISNTHIRSDDYSEKLCLLTPCLDMKGGIQKFGFKLVQGDYYVYFGVCHFDTVKKKEWKWDHHIGGGTYMITSYGNTFSHWDKKINDKPNSFKFFLNNTIYCYFDGQKESITFKNSETLEAYQMKIKYNGEDMYPCVAMYDNTELQLIQPIDVPDL